jgi:hypothetical protein
MKVKMKSASARTRWSVVIAAAWGMLGGVFLVMGQAWGTPRTRALLISLAFVSVVIGSTITLGRSGSRLRRFGLGCGAFMLATLISYFYMGVVVNPHKLNLPVWDHAWRLSFMLAVGALATGAAMVVGAGIRALGGGPGGSPDTRAQPPARIQRSTDTDGFVRRTIVAVRIGPEPLPRS